MHIEVISRLPQDEAHPVPLLFIHGAWHGAWCWDVHFLPYFAEQGFAAYALSLRGHGESYSDKPKLVTSIWDYVTDVAKIAARIEYEHGHAPVLIGHSMGGYVVQKYMERFIIPGAVLLASVPSVGTLPFFLRILRDYLPTALACGALLTTRPLVADVDRVHTLFFSEGMPREVVAQYQGHLVNESALVVLEGMLLSPPRPDRVQPAPLLVLGAAGDAVFPVFEVQATAAAYKTTATILPDTAHDIMLEPNWQPAADRIIAWLRELWPDN
ncbi:MAG: alpha/beta hydrolase [Chloroflexota bacterium]